MEHDLVITYDRIGGDPIEFIIKTILEAGGSKLKRPAETTIEFKLWESSPEHFKKLLDEMEKRFKPRANYVLYEQRILIENRNDGLQEQFDSLVITIIKTGNLVYFD